MDSHNNKHYAGNAAGSQNTPALHKLTDVLLQHHGGSINTILLYGSCLRSNDLFDGLVDLYLIVDNYRAFYRHRLQALSNWLLPPNVFYVEVPIEDRLLRAKYAVVSSVDFTRGTFAWKLERHSGKAVEILERVRRFPLIFIWRLVWREYRRGIFR